MKLEVGMYVRTKQGYIAKFKEYDEIFNILRFETPIFLRSWMPCDYMQKDRFMNRYFLKASHNPIDLIEAGDYVNGYKVDFVQNGYVVFNHNHPYQINIYPEDIKSIVTKEQFEEIKYEIKRDMETNKRF